MPCAICGAWIQRPQWRFEENPHAAYVRDFVSWHFGPNGEVVYAVCQPNALQQQWEQEHAALVNDLPLSRNELVRRLGQLRSLAQCVRKAWYCERSVSDPITADFDEDEVVEPILAEHEVVREEEVAQVPAEHVLETGNSLQQVIALAAALRTPSAACSRRFEEQASADRLLEAVLAEFSDSDLLGEIARRLEERTSRT